MNTDGEPFFMATNGNEGAGISIPAVMISQADGETIKQNIKADTEATITPKVACIYHSLT